MNNTRPAWLDAKVHSKRSEVAPQAPKRRPFFKPVPPALPGQDGTRHTARIFPFTGSNTPYESHE